MSDLHTGIIVPSCWTPAFPKACRCQSQDRAGEKNVQSGRGVRPHEYIPSSLSSQTGGSLLAGHMRWQHRPSLLCSSRHRLNKEEFVQHLFICKSRVWHSNAGSSSRLRWVDTRASWRLLPPPPPRLSLSPLSCSAQVHSVVYLAHQRDGSRARHSSAGGTNFIFSRILYSKEDIFYLFLVRLCSLAMCLDTERVQLGDV